MLLFDYGRVLGPACAICQLLVAAYKLLIAKILVAGCSVRQGRLSLTCPSHACAASHALSQQMCSEREQVHACCHGLKSTIMMIYALQLMMS